MKIQGIITYVPVSGGFWGIVAENGRKFRPLAPLDIQFQVEGLAVEADVEPSQGFSIFMWGTDVQIQRISKTT